MRADNSAHLKRAAAERSERTRRRAEAALETLTAQGLPITVAALARAANVTRSWLYTQPNLIDQIHSNQQEHTTQSHEQQPPSRFTASEPSWQRRLELAHRRIAELTEQNRQLRTQLALAHGQIRSTTLTPSTTPSTTQSQ